MDEVFEVAPDPSEPERHTVPVSLNFRTDIGKKWSDFLITHVRNLFPAIRKTKGHNATETFAKLQQAYGDSVLSRAHVFRWFKAFSEGRESIENLDPSAPSQRKALRFQKPLKMSLEFRILCVQIVA
ncbi:hypothetical protein TNCV_2383071 [Trichonephila clavipes]|nr:hypothetical protein TNCV_2383071 [Trichonephila clavipes]